MGLRAEDDRLAQHANATIKARTRLQPRGAFAIVQASGLTWTLAGCPWIKTGPSRGAYTEHDKFPGGLKSIVPEDVAHFLVKVLGDPAYFNRLVGIWN